MTQAMINSLNMISEKGFNLTDKMSKSEGMDFGKIFEIKSDKLENHTKDIKQKSEYGKTTKYTNSAEKTNHIKNENVNQKDINDKIQKTEYTNNEFELQDDDPQSITLLHGNVEENAEKDDDLKKAILLLNNTEIIDNDDEEEITETTDLNDEENTEETTITEEVPTMYNELNTLEDPAALLMLQSQIKQTVISSAKSEQADDIQEGGANLNTKYQSSSNNSTVFKQFDAAVSKDTSIVNNVFKETSHIKAENSKPAALINENVIKELNVEVVSSQASASENAMGDLMQNQSPQEQAVRIMIQGDIKYDSVASEALKNVSQVKIADFTPSKIIEQISKQLEGMFNNSKLNMVLNPGTLGKLNIQLINSKDGLLAQFTVTTQDAKDILMKGLDGLKESLLAQGINVDNVSVRMEETDGENKSDYTEQENSKGGQKHQGSKKQKEDGKDFEQMMFELEKEGKV